MAPSNLPPTRKRVLPSLEVRPHADMPPPPAGASAVADGGLSWETELRLDNTPSRGAMLQGMRRGTQIDLQAALTAGASMPADKLSPSEAMMRMRLQTPRAKVGSLQPLAGMLPQVAPAPAAVNDSDVVALAAERIAAGGAAGGRYNLRPRKVQALERSIAPESGG
jgi:hypothetical protein